jgi:hypothetical protein
MHRNYFTKILEPCIFISYVIVNLAYFLSDSKTIIHGLEQLIEHYQEDVNGLVVQLSKLFAANEPPPHYSRRNGRTNLLHRATKEGNLITPTNCLDYSMYSNRKLSCGFGAAQMRLPKSGGKKCRRTDSRPLGQQAW